MKRILVVKLADLGDVLTVTPALRALRNAHPTAHIAALVTPGSATLLRGSTAVDEVVPFDKVAFDRPLDAPRSLPAALAFGRRLRAGRWDAVALFHHLTTPFGIAKYAALCLASGAPLRAGLDNGRGWFLNRAAHDDGFGVRHEVDYWLAVAATRGGESSRPALELPRTGEDEAWATTTLRRIGQSGRATVAIHPGSGAFSRARRWEPGRFAALADGLAARHQLAPLILQGTGADERAIAVAVAEAATTPVEIVGPAPRPQALAALLGRVRLLVANDGGAVHLAVTARTPVVAVFGPSNDRAWGPYPPTDPRHAVVREQLACTPCIHRGHSFGTPQGCAARTCLDLVTPAAVLDAVARVLAASAAAALSGTGATVSEGR